MICGRLVLTTAAILAVQFYALCSISSSIYVLNYKRRSFGYFGFMASLLYAGSIYRRFSR